jgi:hypothetical protein
MRLVISRDEAGCHLSQSHTFSFACLLGFVSGNAEIESRVDCKLHNRIVGDRAIDRGVPTFGDRPFGYLDLHQDNSGMVFTTAKLPRRFARPSSEGMIEGACILKPEKPSAYFRRTRCCPSNLVAWPEEGSLRTRLDKDARRIVADHFCGPGRRGSDRPSRPRRQQSSLHRCA